ncbi:SMI1/KNR4 family protein [Rossellomorea marisflavi]|uniref:SMI1/KNR4 family protein n=1 Tax=Rossellomorea marisflavi TaxID=189381 RepID=UPI0027A0EEE5|nr:SMI1/KNR4 family protein [Rossellomorea marisflavi]UTE73384.1 SMI1/KNR4 family protein [Rossellomorea marisflavi]
MRRFQEIDDKLRLLGMTSKYELNPIDSIKGANLLPFSLPLDYKDFLIKYSPLNYDAAIHLIPSLSKNTFDEPLSLINFYGFSPGTSNLLTVMKRYRDRIPGELIPIAECPGGDQICIGTGNEVFGKIYYWDHDKEKLHVNSQEDIWGPVTLIHPSFYDLIMSVQKVEETEATENPTIVEMKISDAFLARIRK